MLSTITLTHKAFNQILFHKSKVFIVINTHKGVFKYKRLMYRLLTRVESRDFLKNSESLPYMTRFVVHIAKIVGYILFITIS